MQKRVELHSHGELKVKREPKWLNFVNKKLKRCSISSKTSLWLFIRKWLGSQCFITGRIRDANSRPLYFRLRNSHLRNQKGERNKQHRGRRNWRTSGREDFKLKPIEGEMVGTSIRGHSFADSSRRLIDAGGAIVVDSETREWSETKRCRQTFSHHSTQHLHDVS
jgi:hypothetical protein